MKKTRKLAPKKETPDASDPRWGWALYVGPTAPTRKQLEELLEVWNAIGSDLLEIWKAEGMKGCAWALREFGRPQS